MVQKYVWEHCTDSLFDLGKDINLLTEREKKFCKDQKTQRKCYLSEELDREVELERQNNASNWERKRGLSFVRTFIYY